ncbi:hypothetical protein L3Y34_005056 [Caenorhabditis briggsae]|uniref:aECM cysteine-cradle domain-containing protein n=1 Tax=Caenorhabditis briggsae TaxID=6238 RepID=A0AAE9ADJ8_CAEBR|nr:hypothetical protein L3Y34_005056 [Caenorhabditis briggsae]
MTTTCRLILLLLMAIGIQEVYSNTHSVLERYEERLNSALSKRTGVPRTVKRYKCVEEYVTYDQHGRQVTSYQGPKFTTTMEPPTYRTSGEKEIRRKPAKKVTIAINRDSEPTTSTQKTVTSSTESNQPTSSLKPFDEMNDEEADRIIEEMYLKKKESHATESPEELPEVIRTESTQPPLPPPPPPPQKTHAYSTSSSSANNGVGLPPSRYSTVKQQRNNRIRETEDDEDYPRSVYHRDSRKRPYDMSTYDDYDDIPLYRPMRREYRMRRRRPIMFSDDFSDDTDFDERIESNPRRQTTRDLSPLRSIKSLRHLPPQYRQPGPPPPAPLSLPVSSSTNMIHRPAPLPMVPPHMRMPPAPPGPHPMMPMPPGLGQVPMMPPPQPLQPLQQQQSINPGEQEVLKMKPILQANPQEMQVATAESCAKITKLAKSFNIKDVSKWARSNCAFLQMYAPTASCELIFHFIDSCRSKKFF